MTADEFELRDIPRQLVYEQSKWGCPASYCVGAGPDAPTVDQVARQKHAWLLARQKALAYRIRYRAVMDRWVMRKYPKFPRINRNAPLPPREAFTPMGMDEIIVGHRIVDDGD